MIRVVTCGAAVSFFSMWVKVEEKQLRTCWSKFVFVTLYSKMKSLSYLGKF